MIWPSPVLSIPVHSSSGPTGYVSMASGSLRLMLVTAAWNAAWASGI
jgi:hypothetical protein